MLETVRLFMAILYLLSIIMSFVIGFLQRSLKNKGVNGIFKMMEYESTLTLLSLMMFLSGIILSILTLVK